MQSDGAIKDSLNIGGQPFRVLIIEDDVELARLTAEYLQNRGLRVDVEHRGDHALARIENVLFLSGKKIIQA